MSEVLKRIPQGRVVSIDALRGFDMFWIIGGDGVFRAFIAFSAIPWLQPLAGQLGHTDWNGFTFYDLIFSLVWNLGFPINKLLWSSSYVLHAGGWSLLLLGVFYWIIDVKGYRAWSLFFVVIGLNPITIYVLQSQFDFGIITHIFTRGFIGYLGNFAPLVEQGGFLLFSWLFLYFLYRKKIFLKA